MKKKLFFVLLLSGSMFLNFNIADAKGSTEVTTFSQYTTIANDCWGNAGGGHHWNQLLIGNYQEFYMFNYSPKEEEILIDLYNLILDKEVGIKERELYKKAILLIEKENEYYEAVLFQLAPALAYLARQKSISSNGGIFMTKISRFTNNSIGFYLFDSILKK